MYFRRILDDETEIEEEIPVKLTLERKRLDNSDEEQLSSDDEYGKMMH